MIKIDTTVIESDIEHPTDAKVLKQGIHKLGRLVRQCRQAGLSAAGSFVNHWRKVRQYMLEIAKISRRRTGKAIQEIDRITAKLAVIAEETLSQARRVLKAAKLSLARGSGKLRERLVEGLAETCVLMEKAI